MPRRATMSPRQLEVNGPLVAQHGVQAHGSISGKAVCGSLSTAESYRQLLKGFPLRVEFPDLVVKEWVFLTFALHPWRTTDRTTTGDFSAKAPAVELATLSPANAIGVTQTTPRPWIRVRRRPRRNLRPARRVVVTTRARWRPVDRRNREHSRPEFKTHGRHARACNDRAIR